MIQELLGGAAMDQLKSVNDGNPASLPLLLHPIVSNPSPTSSSSTSSRSSAQQHHHQQQRSTSATSSPQGQGQGQQAGAEQTPLRCPRCNSSNTKFCYYNNYNLTQPRHFCKTCRRYWTKGGALRNVPIGGGCRKPRPMPAPVAKPAVSCKALVGGGAPSLGLGMGVGMGSGPMMPWASSQQAAAAQLMALLNSARQGVQGGGGGGGGNMHRLLGLDTMPPHLPGIHVLPGAGNAGGGAPPSLWPPAAPRHVPTTPPHMDAQLGMGTLGQHDVLSGLGLKLPPPSPPPPASYYSDQLHAVVSSAAGRPHEYDAPCGATSASLPCTTAAASSLPPPASSVSAALCSAATIGLDLPTVSLPAAEMQYWAGSAAMSVAWPDLPTPNGAFP
ncbi:unnamed protein product [Urochloa humidicola]